LSFGYLLLWMIGISNLSLVVRALRTRPVQNYGWMLASTLVLLGMGIIAHLTDLDTAGYAGAVLWALLVAIPNIGGKRIEGLCRKHQYARAKGLAIFFRVLHPSRDYRQLPSVIDALKSAYDGKALSTAEMLRRIGVANDSLSGSLLAHWFSLTGDWTGFVEWVRQTGGESRVERDHNLAANYLRALGETGNLESLVRLSSRFSRWSTDVSGYSNAVRRLFLFSFCGRKNAVVNLFNGPLKQFPSSNQLFWLATAGMAAGEPQAAETFRLLTASEDLRIRKGAERRIKDPVALAETSLSISALHEVSQQEAEARIDDRLLAGPVKNSRKPYATYGLIAANLVMFGLEGLYGGSENSEALFRLGALVPQMVLAGQWWRLPAAMFLHFGPLHLGMNMLALFLVGPFVEFAVGTPRYLICYLGSGMLSMGMVCVLVLYGVLGEQFLVGASGAIMGLIGASAAIFFRIWRTERTQFASQRLNSLGVALLIQLAFDLSTPEVSLSSHLAGVIAGALIGLSLRHRVGSSAS